MKEELQNFFTNLDNLSTLNNIFIEDLETNIINDTISSEEYKIQIKDLLKSNKKNNTINSYKFYTDRSLNNRGSKEIKMGAAWIQTVGPYSDSVFKTGVDNWPSAARAEATAIATAILTVPQDKKVEIFMDSQNCINNYTYLLTNNPKQTHKRWLKMNNWSIWSTIINTVKKKNIKLTLTKVKAHSNNPLNDKANILAKEASQLPSISWTQFRKYKIQTIPKWKEIIIDIAPRNFIKEINKIKILKEWTNQQRIQNLFGQEIQEPDKYK